MNHTDTNEQPSEALMPCPFCAATWAKVFGPTTTPISAAWMVHCQGCGVETAGWETREHAIQHWNTRSRAVGVAPGDESVAFTAYNQAIEDAKQAIRDESWAGSDAAPSFINAIARRCSPHRYVAQVAATTSSPAAQPDGDSLALSAKLARVAQRFNNATTHDEVAALVWAGRALIDADAEQAPFFTVEYQDKTLVYRAVLGLYFEHAKRVLGREPYPVEVDQIETGFCNPWLEAKKPERMERGRQLLVEILADQSPAAQPEDGPHPGYDCGGTCAVHKFVIGPSPAAAAEGEQE